LAQGNKDALSSIDNEPVREKAERIFDCLTLSGAWDEPENLSNEGCGEIGENTSWKLRDFSGDTLSIECIFDTENIPDTEINALSLDAEIDEQFTDEFNLDELI
jgi:hypothetical protein